MKQKFAPNFAAANFQPSFSGFSRNFRHFSFLSSGQGWPRVAAINNPRLAASTHTHTHSNARSRRGHFRAKGNSRRTSTSGISRSAATRNFLLLAPKLRFLARFSRHFRSQWALRDDDDELFFSSSFTGKFRINRFHHLPRHETEPVFVSKINNGNSHGVPKFLAPADGEREQRDVVVPSDSCVV